MKLEGSCHCKLVKFSVNSTTPYPFNKCYCSICRKTAGTSGCGINIMGEYATLKVEGEEHMKVYQAMKNGKKSESRRYFCGECGTALYIYSPTWPEWVYPHTGAIDTPLPVPPSYVHLMVDSKASWVELPQESEKDAIFKEYPSGGIMDWHKKHNLLVD